MQRAEGAERDLVERVRRLEERVERLESGLPAPAATPEISASVQELPVESEDQGENLVALIGRTLLILGGAYLLRAMTDAGVVPPMAGVAAGLAWAVAWLVAADRAAAHPESRLSASMYVLAAMLIGAPLLVEASWRFDVISAVPGAILLSAFAAMGLGIAWRRSLIPAAWLVSLGSIGAAVLMAVATRDPLPFTLVLIGLGLAMLWLSYLRDWFIVRWIPAIAADLAVAVMTVLAVRPSSGIGIAPALSVQMLLLAGYLGSFAVRTIARGRVVLPFEIAQSAAALLLGIGGAVWVTAGAPSLHLLLGLALTLLAAAAYAVAFAFLERHADKVRNFLFYSSIALSLAMAGTLLLLPRAALALTWASLGLLAAAVAERFARRTLAAHAAVFVVGAAVAGGGALAAIEALSLPVSRTWLAFSWEHWSVMALAAAAFWTIGLRRSEFAHRARSARLVLLSTFVLLAAGAAIHVGRNVGAAGEAGTCAAWRTVVLCSAAVLLALAGTRVRGVEAARLVSPLLVAIGVKLAIEDLRVGRPITLFVAFAAYGGALILATRLRRKAALLARRVAPEATPGHHAGGP